MLSLPRRPAHSNPWTGVSELIHDPLLLFLPATLYQRNESSAAAAVSITINLLQHN
ncbi:hypothetical protein E2C01_090013 [Portunus trituberculatus]|uniref:Uncharacterized protein n=1 Tax=Portunus trituberculatus TaxID=210409 RepID=A0A5B7JNZ2_PORTR|nr:hypothetical protein [Portunus trituberculatus]